MKVGFHTSSVSILFVGVLFHTAWIIQGHTKSENTPSLRENSLYETNSDTNALSHTHFPTHESELECPYCFEEISKDDKDNDLLVACRNTVNPHFYHRHCIIDELRRKFERNSEAFEQTARCALCHTEFQSEEFRETLIKAVSAAAAETHNLKKWFINEPLRYLKVSSKARELYQNVLRHHMNYFLIHPEYLKDEVQNFKKSIQENIQKPLQVGLTAIFAEESSEVMKRFDSNRQKQGWAWLQHANEHWLYGAVEAHALKDLETILKTQLQDIADVRELCEEIQGRKKMFVLPDEIQQVFAKVSSLALPELTIQHNTYGYIPRRCFDLVPELIMYESTLRLRISKISKWNVMNTPSMQTQQNSSNRRRLCSLFGNCHLRRKTIVSETRDIERPFIKV